MSNKFKLSIIILALSLGLASYSIYKKADVRAAEQADADNKYDANFSVAQDDVKAFEWYEKAAQEGDAEVQNYLGGCMLQVLVFSRTMLKRLRV